jgi:hypothetical protein
VLQMGATGKEEESVESDKVERKVVSVLTD